MSTSSHRSLYSARPTSTLLHGPDEVGIAALATALALRECSSFAWADCARPALVPDLPSHGLFGRGSQRPGVGGVTPSLVRPPNYSSGSLDRLVAGPSSIDRQRLRQFVALPELLQRLAAQSRDEGGRSVILVANTDALGSAEQVALLGPKELHLVLRSIGISLIVTARIRPVESLLVGFDQVLRMTHPNPRSWADGLIEVERSPVWAQGHGTIPIRDAWVGWKLDPRLIVQS